MRRILGAFFFLVCGLWAQPVQQVLPNPDCQIFFTLSASGANSPVLDNRQNGCTSWSMVYVNSGFSAVSVTLQSAANNAGVPGTYGIGFPVQQTVVSGSNPGTSTAAGFVWLSGVNAFVRVLLTATGSGVVNGAVYGWRIPNAASQGGGGGGLVCLSGDVTAGTGSCTAATVVGLESVPFCTGYTPTNGQFVQYTTGGSPNPCYTAAAAPTPPTIASTTNTLKGDGSGNAVAVTGTGTNCVLVNGSSGACGSGGTGNAADPETYTPSASVTLTCASSTAGTVSTFDPAGSTALAANMAVTFASCTTGQVVILRVIQAASGGPYTVSGLPTGSPQISTYPSAVTVYTFKAASATTMNFVGVAAVGGASSLGAGAQGISRTVTAGSSGVTANLLAAKDASNPTDYNTAGLGGCGSGVAAYTAGAGATFELYTVPGTVLSMVADGTITAGHLLTGGSSTAGRVADTGQTARTAVSNEICIVGVALASATVGNSVLVAYDGTGVYGAETDLTTVTGILPIANGGTGAATTSQNFAFIGPTSGSGAPSFRALVTGDLPGGAYVQLQSSSPGTQQTGNSNISGVAFSGLGSGVGTQTGMANSFMVASTVATTPRGLITGQWSTDNSSARISGYKARGTQTSPTTVATGDFITRWSGFAYDGSNYLESSSIVGSVQGTVASTRTPGQIDFYTMTDVAPSVLTLAATINKAQVMNFANTPTVGGTAMVYQGGPQSLYLGAAVGNSPTANAILYADGSGNLQNAPGITRTGPAQLTLGTATSPGNQITLGTTATDSAALGPELTTSGTCSGTGWTGTYPNYVAPGTTNPLTCTGFTSGQFYQTVTTIGAGGSGSVAIAIGTAQTASGSSGTVTAGLKANGTSLTYTPAATYTGTIGISAKLISPITTFSYIGKDSTGAISYEALYQTLGSLNNSFLGGGGSFNTTGTQNSAQGLNALYSNTTGGGNSAQGYAALYSNTTGSYNSAQGVNALYSNTTGSYNSAQGFAALYSNTTGTQNSAQGYQALYSNTTGNNNSAQGYAALQYNTTGSYNSAQGGSALQSNTTGSYNSAQGVNALYSNTTGSNNSAQGLNVLYSNTTGSNNSAQGYAAGYTATSANANKTGSNNSWVGYNSGPGSATQYNYQSVIGAAATGTCSNCVVLGRAGGLDTVYAGDAGVDPMVVLALATTPVLSTALKTCTATTGIPWRASVTDAVAPALGVALTGGGGVFANVHCSLTTGTYIVDGL